MKNTLFILAAFVLLGAACNKAQAPTNTDNLPFSPDQPTSGNQNSSPAPAAAVSTYRNATYNFEFQYSAEFSFTDAIYANLQQKIVQVNLAQSEYPKTNFGDAALSFSIQPVSSLQACLSANLSENAAGFKETRSINGVTFYLGQGNGAAAGNFYDSRIFRTFRSGSCFEIAETLHTSNIGNYEPGTVTEVDPKPIWERLDKILASFKFTA